MNRDNPDHPPVTGSTPKPVPHFKSKPDPTTSSTLQPTGALDDLHMALKSCNEIDSAKTLYMFLIDLQKINPDIPSRKNTEIIRKDK